MTSTLVDFLGTGTLPAPYTDFEPVPHEGVVASGDAAISSVSVNSSTGAITFTLAAAAPVWIKHAVGLFLPVRFAGLTRTLTPTTLPTSTNYRGYGLELSENKTVSLSSAGAGGGDNATLAAALASVNSLAANDSLRVADVVVLNTAGSYSLAGTRDRRPWAAGAYSTVRRASDISITGIAAEAIIDSTNLQARIETATGQLRCSLQAQVSNTGASVGNFDFSLWVDGARQTNVPYYRQAITNGNAAAVALVWEVTALSAGSHLIAPAWAAPNGSTAIRLNGTSNGAQGITFTVEEITKTNANNGTT